MEQFADFLNDKGASGCKQCGHNKLNIVTDHSLELIELSLPLYNSSKKGFRNFVTVCEKCYHTNLHFASQIEKEINKTNKKG